MQVDSMNAQFYETNRLFRLPAEGRFCVRKSGRAAYRTRLTPGGPLGFQTPRRNTYGRGIHRFHAGFLDYACHAGFLPRLCQPYRAQTKGKVERLIGYLKRSF
jgi:hypothetical protein